MATVDALQLEVGDIVSVTHSSPGWSAKPFRITGLSLQPDGNVGVTLQEHQNSVYVWNEGDEVPVYADTTLPDPFQVTAVDVNTVSVASSEAINDNGSSTQRFLVSWTEPSDEFITEYVVQYKESSSASWNGEVKTDSSPIYISGIQSGVAYNVRVKALNAIGVSSAWATLASAVTAANLTTEAGGGNTTYYQNTAPTGDLTEGDLWFDTDDSNKLYRYNGTSWQAASGTLFNKDEVSESEINLTNDKLADITTDLGAITAGSLNIGSGKFVVDTSGTCTIKSSASGERLEITNDTIKVYDSAGTLRVLIGDLT